MQEPEGTTWQPNTEWLRSAISYFTIETWDVKPAFSSPASKHIQLQYSLFKLHCVSHSCIHLKCKALCAEIRDVNYSYNILNNCVLSPLPLSLTIPPQAASTIMWSFTVDAAGHVQLLSALSDRYILQTSSAGRAFGQATRRLCRPWLWDLLTNAQSTRALHVNTNGMWRVKHPVITVGNGTECIMARPPPLSSLSLWPLQPTQIKEEVRDDHERCSLWAIAFNKNRHSIFL